MSKILTVLVVLGWAWINWLVLRGNKGCGEDYKDGHEQLDLTKYAVQDYMNKLKAAQETNETLYKRQHYDEQPWYERFRMWFNDKSNEYMECEIYRQARKEKILQQSFEWETYKMRALINDYLLYIQFVTFVLVLVAYGRLIDRVAEIRGLIDDDSDETPDSPDARDRAMHAEHARRKQPTGREAKRSRGGRAGKMAIVV